MDSIQTFADIAAKEYSTGQDAPDGEAAPETEAPLPGQDAREARLAVRLKHLEQLRIIGMEIAVGLGHAAAGRHQFNSGVFAKITDPATSFTRIAHAIRRIVALEESLEAEGAAQIASLAEAARRKARDSLIERKRTVRRAVTQAHKDAHPEMERYRREKLLDDLFNDYDDYHKGTLAEIIAAICADLGVTPDLTLWEEGPVKDGEPDPAQVKARTVKLAENYREAVKQTASPPPAQAPRKRGRGPPG